MVERRDLFRICQTLPISDAEKNRRPAGGDARTAVRQVLSFIRQVAEPSICGSVPSARSSRRPAPAQPPQPRTAQPRTATAAATATTATPANNNDGELHVAAIDFLIGEIERGETDVGHFLFAKNEALIGRDVVRLREISSGYRVRGCASPQRKSQSGCTECRCGGGFGCARVLRSLLHPWHGRILRCCERVDLT